MDPFFAVSLLLGAKCIGECDLCRESRGKALFSSLVITTFPLVQSQNASFGIQAYRLPRYLAVSTANGERLPRRGDSLTFCSPANAKCLVNCSCESLLPFGNFPTDGRDDTMSTDLSTGQYSTDPSDLSPPKAAGSKPCKGVPGADRAMSMIIGDDHR